MSGDAIVHVCMLVCACFTTCAGVRTGVWPIALYVSHHFGSANLERFVWAHTNRGRIRRGSVGLRLASFDSLAPKVL